MAKTRRNRKSNFLKNIKKTTEKAAPVVNKGLTKIGTTAEGLAVKSVPIVKKGVSTVYGTLASGFDLGVKGVKTVAKRVKKNKRSKKNRKTRKN